jgi:long-subunit fatty acid transport protein
MKRKTGLVFSACAFGALSVCGNGFYIPVQAPEATARGNAWLATADTAAAVYYNAAGLTQMDTPEVTVGTYASMPGLEAELDSGAREKADNDWAVLPQIYKCSQQPRDARFHDPRHPRRGIFLPAVQGMELRSQHRVGQLG